MTSERAAAFTVEELIRGAVGKQADNAQTARLFQRSDLTGHEAYDIARGQVDTAGGLRRASGTMLPRR